MKLKVAIQTLDGKQLDKKDFSGYIAEKIEEHIRECL